jgi:hypothetical protein
MFGKRNVVKCRDMALEERSETSERLELEVGWQSYVLVSQFAVASTGAHSMMLLLL